MDLDLFLYDRTYPPLYVLKPENKEEEIKMKDLYESTTKEFFKKCSDEGVSHETLLTSGITVGEFSMELIKNRNSKRLKSKQGE